MRDNAAECQAERFTLKNIGCLYRDTCRQTHGKGQRVRRNKSEEEIYTMYKHAKIHQHSDYDNTHTRAFNSHTTQI